MSDHPFDDVVKTADEYIAQGCTVHQKFSCEHCGLRLTIETPNVFYTFGTCDKCGRVTDIRKNGCNYLMISGLSE